MINSNDKQSLAKILSETQYKTKNDSLSTSEYRDLYNGDRLYNASK